MADECSASTPITINASEFTSVRRSMFDAAMQRWGKDVLASEAPPESPVPRTPPEFAKQCADTWSLIFGKYGARYVFPNNGTFVALRDGVVELYEAVKLAQFGRTAADGVKVMDPFTCKWFWDEMLSLAIAFQSKSGDVTFTEEWRAAWCGAKEGLNNAAETVGKVAGELAATIGKATGAGIGGILEGVGLVNVALIAGGVYVVTRVL